MVLLLLTVSWMLTLSLICCLCVAARNGDRQQGRPTSPAVLGEPESPSIVVTITQGKYGQHTTPDHSSAGALAWVLSRLLVEASER